MKIIKTRYIGGGPEAHLYRMFHHYHNNLNSDVAENRDETNLREIFTCSVGRKPSKASFYLNSANDVNALLEKLAGISLSTNS